MNIDNITSDSMTLTNNGKAMLIKVYEEEIERLNNIINKAIEYIDWQRRNPQYDNVWRNSECEDLIEILKGSE